MDQIMDFVSELSKLRSSSTFLTLKGYRNESSEVADYNIVFHMSYANALTKSIEVLNKLKTPSDLEKQAKTELLTSFRTSLAKMEVTPLEDVDDAYTRFTDDDGSYIKGVKLHTNTSTLHLYGLVVHKRVLLPGNYGKKPNKKPLTMVKDKMRSICPIGKFRQFRIVSSQVDRIAVENLSLLPPE